MHTKHSEKRVSRNILRAHSDGTFSVRINGRWSRGLRELSQDQYLSLLACDRDRLVLREFDTGHSVTGSAGHRVPTQYGGRMKLRFEMRHSSGILCELEADENGFVDLFIAEGQRLPPEWIVRGALDQYKALLQTDWIIKERLAGRSIIHDAEGRIFSLPIPPTN